MKYFLDTEFNGFGGALISLALVSEAGPSLYLLYRLPRVLDPWMRDHVLPNLMALPAGVEARHVTQAGGAHAIDAFLRDDPDPVIIADWPDDVRLFCHALMIKPGVTAPLDQLRFEIRRVAPYPTDLEGAVEHNACWDALALRHRLMWRGGL